MGTSQNNKRNNIENETNKSGIVVDNFCSRVDDRNYNIREDKNEIILSKTYSYPKGTYTQESTKFFNDNEKYLFYFCEGENIAAIRYLTIKGVHINILDQDRTSPLHIACKLGSLKLVEEILIQGATINMPDIVGWTPLHVACYNKRSDVVLLLLKYGANWKIKDRDGVYPIDLARYDQECLDIINNFVMHSSLNYESVPFNMVEKDYYLDSDIYSSNNNIEVIANEEDLNNTSKNYPLISVNNSQLNNINPKYLSNKSKLDKLDKKKINMANRSYYSDTSKGSVDNEEDEKTKQDARKILDNYKLIPKKHKFYEKYGSNINEKSSKSVMNISESQKSKQLVSPRLNTQISNNKNLIRKETAQSNINTNCSIFSNYTMFNTFGNNKLCKKSESFIQTPSIKSINLRNDNKNNSIVNKPRAFPITNSINSINEYFKENYAESREYNSVINLRHSYNLKNEEYGSNFNMKKRKVMFSEIDIDDEDDKEFKVNSENENKNINVDSYYNVDIDSEKYKKYTSSESDSDDSFKIDTAIVNEMQGYKFLKLNLSNKLKNKGRTNTHNWDNKNSSEVKLNLDLNDQTICIDPIEFDDTEDSVVFSEHIANFRPAKFPNNLTHLNKMVVFNPDNSKKLFNKSETENFFKNFKFSSILLKSLSLNITKLESIIHSMFRIDSNFGLLFISNLLDTDNNSEKLISSIKSNFKNKELILKILTPKLNESKEIIETKNLISDKFFESFNYDNAYLKDNFKKCLKYLLFDKDKCLIDIDQVSKSFSKAFYKSLYKNKEKNYFNSQHSVYMFIFTLFITDVDIKDIKTLKGDNINKDNNKYRNKKFYDLLIILKNLNEGKNFDNLLLKDYLKFSKLIGISNVISSSVSAFASMNLKSDKRLGFYKNGKLKNYLYICDKNGAMILIKDEDTNLIKKFLFIKNEYNYNYKIDLKNQVITIESRYLNKNILVLNNKISYMKCKKYSSLLFKFDKKEEFREVIDSLKN